MSSSSNVCGVYPRHARKIMIVFLFLKYIPLATYLAHIHPRRTRLYGILRLRARPSSLWANESTNGICWMFVVVLGITGLEASRAPYSKSHARRLKRREKEQLTGRLGSLKAALPSIAPTATTSSAAIVGERSAEDVDAATATTSTTVTAARSGATVKPTQQPTITAIPRPTRPGQIGEGNDAPLTKSQRRRALYGLIIANHRFFFVFATEATSFLFF